MEVLNNLNFHKLLDDIIIITVDNLLTLFIVVKSYFNLYFVTVVQCKILFLF